MFTPSKEFQTPPIVCSYMTHMIKTSGNVILEPTPGEGNLVSYLSSRGLVITPYGDFWDFHREHFLNQMKKYDYVVMNPPFTPVVEGWKFLNACFEMSDKIIALVPWLILINSERRMKMLTDFGLKSVTHLPRKAFPGSRIQCCIVELDRNFAGETIFRHFTW